MFQSARLKLTTIYVLIALIITAFFSLQAYSGFGLEIARGLQRQRIFIEEDTATPSAHLHVIGNRKVDPALLADERQRFLVRILLTDLLIIIISAGAGYILAGKTLQPIQEMVDEQHRFITDASHELNTPLTSLKTTIEVNLRDANLTAQEARKVLESNLEEVDELQALSGELIALAQYQKAPSQLIFEHVDMRTIIQAAIKKTTPLAKKKHIILTHDIPLISIRGNKKSLIELFVILLDNAIKYSPEQKTVQIQAESTEKYITILVKDSGNGIEKEDMPYIFNRFYRADKSRTKQQVSGYGLGLSIAQRIVAVHDGKISVKSISGSGSTFTVELPLLTQES